MSEKDDTDYDVNFYENQAVEEKLFNLDMNLGLYGFLTKKSIIEELRLLAKSMSSHKAMADKIGISPAYLSDVISGRRDPGPKVCKFLRVEPVLVYREMLK